MSFQPLDLEGLRIALRDKTGFPERGDTGKDRFNRVLNLSLRRLWADLPDALLAQEHRFKVVPSITSVSTGATITVDASDPLVFRINDTLVNISPKNVWRGAWLRVKKGGSYYYRRVADLYRVSWSGTDYDTLVLDEPWFNTTDNGLEWRLFFLEYPIPGDVQRVLSMVRNPETEGYRWIDPVFPDQMEAIRTGTNIDQDGQIQAWCSGNFFQLPAPHYTPTVSVKSATLPEDRWGRDPSNGVERVRYGPAGTFQYITVHVWGRLPDTELTLAGYSLPKYMSAPSKPSAQITTTWNAGGIRVQTPDIDYVHGYGDDSALRSYHHSGVEKWVFRRRVDTQSATGSGNNATVKLVENDDGYYLVKVIAGSDNNWDDQGQEDPPDIRVRLKDFYGHQHVRFDRQPTEDTFFAARVVRRPPTLDHDTDAPSIPSEGWNALVAHCASILAGERDGDPNRTTFYIEEYREELGRLRANYATNGSGPHAFGIATGPPRSTRAGYRIGPIREST